MLALYDKKSDIKWRNGKVFTKSEIKQSDHLSGLLNGKDCVLIQDELGRTQNWYYLDILKVQYGVSADDPEKALEEIREKWGCYNKQKIQDAFLTTAPQIQAEQDAAICELYELIEGSVE